MACYLLGHGPGNWVVFFKWTYHTLPYQFLEVKNEYCREDKLLYVISDAKKSKNLPVYVIKESMWCYILSMNPMIMIEMVSSSIDIEQSHKLNSVWKMFSDGPYYWKGTGAGVILIPPTTHNISQSIKLEFDSINNVVEYEELIIGLETTQKMGVKNITVFGDSELVVLQVRNITTKHPRMRSYHNVVWNIITKYFDALTLWLCIEKITNMQMHWQ